MLVMALLAGGARPAAADEALDRLLARTTAYVQTYTDAFSRIVADETFEQQMVEPGLRRVPRHRTLDSEVFFVALDARGGAMTVRRVLQMDGQPVPATDGRIEAALAAPAEESRRALRILADEGARHNLGDLTRNFSDPTLAMLFAGPGYRDRFRFSTDGAEVIDGVTTTRLVFRERDRPTVVRDERGGSVPASGTLFVDADGRVRRSELRLGRGATSARLQVRFVDEPRLGMLVPASLDEEYFYTRTARGPRIRITGLARYSRFRRFETSGRIVTP